MFRWIPFVFVRVVVFFIAGILAGIYLPDSIPEFIAQSLLLIFIALYFIFYIIKNNLKPPVNLGVIGLVVVFLSGYVLLLLKTDSRNAQHFIHSQKQIEYYTAIIDNYTQEKDKSWKVEAVVTEIRVDSIWQKTKGRILFYFSKRDFKKPFAYGDQLLIKGNPALLTPPGNPGEFDYKRFLTFKGIYHQHFLRGDDVVKMSCTPANKMYAYAIQARLWADSKLKQYVTGEREYGIASALVLGVTDGLDNEIMRAYSATGALHVLSVSGLHVSIIYAILLLLLKPLSKKQSGKWTLAIISLLVLWGYAFITGLSPSVMRAVTMFSFIALARPLNWTTNIYNTLAASAFCLLLYDPYLIMSVGFQLSYIAVLGIVYLQRPLYQWWEAPNWLLNKIWQITSVSIAAQLATVSLGLLYFHQFPVYFIFSNLLVIPVSFAVLVLGLLVPLVSFIPIVASIIGVVLSLSIKLMNISVLVIEAFPYSLIDNVFITTLQSWLIMIILILIIVLIKYKKFYVTVTTASLIVFFSITQWMHYEMNIDTNQLVVYKVTGHRAVDFIKTGTSHFLTDSVLQNDVEKIRFHIRPNRLINGVEHIKMIQSEPFVKKLNGCQLVRWEGKTILILENKAITLPTFTVDYVILSHNAMSLSSIIEKIKFKTLILDSSNSFYFSEKIKQEADLLNISVYSVIHQGAFIQNL